MQKPEPTQLPNSTTTRVDQPHAVGPALLRGSRTLAPHAVAVAEIASSAGVDLEASSIALDDRSSRHAGELADRLSQQASELDRRTALLDRQEAEIENKLRAARMWIEDRQRELDARQATIESHEPGDSASTVVSRATVEARQRELDVRQADLYRQVEQLTHDRATAIALRDEAANSQEQQREREAELQRRLEQFEIRHTEQLRQVAVLEVRSRELASLTDTLTEREEQLAFRQREIETSLTRFQRLGIVEQRLAETNEQAAAFAARARHLDEAEIQLAADSEQLIAERKRLATDRSRWQESIVTERRQLSAERETWLAERRTREQQLAHRESQLDAREQSLQQLRAELEVSQREALELRLATEETWAQLAGALAPASLTRSIAQTRAKLADQFQFVLRDLATKQGEFEKLRNTVASEHADLATRQQQLHDWAVRREEDLQSQAMRLITREQELDRQQAHYEHDAADWTRERDELNTRLRKLLAEVRTSTLRSAA